MTTWGQKTESVEQTSPDIIAEQVDRLKDLFPEVVSEGKVDFEMLKTMLGEIVDDRAERYSFTWAGKRDAIRLLQVPSRATLKPCPEESVDWETTGNVFIEGENLEVLKLLYKSYAGRVKMVYIDPPYNTGKEFIYTDNFADPLNTYLQLTNQADSEGNLLTSNPETSGRYHSAWLSMMYPRLFVARQLLRVDGFIVVSIDDTEFYNLRRMLNEIMGEENWIATLVWDRNRKNDAKFFSIGHEYMLVYAKDKQFLRQNNTILRSTKEGVEEIREYFTELRKKHKDNWGQIESDLREFFRTLDDDDPKKPLSRFNKVDARGPYRDDRDISWPGGGGPSYDVAHPITGRACKVPRRGWVFPTLERMREEIEKGNVAFGPDETTVPSLKSYLFENVTQVMRSVIFSYAQKATQEFDVLFGGHHVFDNPKHYADLSQIVEYLTDENDLILDFFAGTCPTAHAVYDVNLKCKSYRNFICIQLQEPVNKKEASGKNALELGYKTIADIGKDRIHRVIDNIHHDAQGQQPLLIEHEYQGDFGFRVFKLGESNYRQWVGVGEKDDEAYAEQMSLFTDLLKPGWVPEDVIWEVALKEGYSLSSLIENLSEITGNQVWRITDPDRGQSFYISLDDVLKEATVQAMRLNKEDLFVCRDAALTDEMAVNLALQCKLKIL